MTTLWSCPNPDCPPTEVAPVDVGSGETAGTESDTEFSTHELAELLHVPVDRIYRWLAAGTGPPAYQVGRQFRFRLSDVMRWAAEKDSRELAICGSKCGRTYPRNEFKQVPES